MTTHQSATSNRYTSTVTLMWLGAGLFMGIAGLFIWAARGERVFSDLVQATLAWCL
jgi:hypothetical protein